MVFLTPDAQYADDGHIERETSGDGIEWRIYRERSVDAIPAEALASADVVVNWHVLPIDEEFISRLGRCRIIVRAGVGTDHIDLRAAGEAGIPVCNTPDYGVSEVADHTIGLMLALRRGIVLHDRRMRESVRSAFALPTPSLVRRNRGGEFGIVGFGAIGMATARRAQALGMNALVYDPYSPSGIEISLGVERLGHLEALLERADVISLHCPLTSETRGLFGTSAFHRMKEESILINTARGPVVEIPALIKALDSGRLGGAALDVFDDEPLSEDSELAYYLRSGARAVAESRLILTPHAGWTSPESAADVRRLSVETAMLYLRRGRLRNAVNLKYLTTPRPESSGPPL